MSIQPTFVWSHRITKKTPKTKLYKAELQLLLFLKRLKTNRGISSTWPSRKRINTDYLYSEKWFIFMKCLATESQGSTFLDVWLQIKRKEKLFPKILKYCISFKHQGQTLHSQKLVCIHKADFFFFNLFMNIHKIYAFCFLYSCQSFTGSLDYSKNKYVQSCSSFFQFSFPFLL